MFAQKYSISCKQMKFQIKNELLLQVCKFWACSLFNHDGIIGHKRDVRIVEGLIEI